MLSAILAVGCWWWYRRMWAREPRRLRTAVLALLAGWFALSITVETVTYVVPGAGLLVLLVVALLPLSVFVLAAMLVRNGLRMVYASSAATYGDGENGFLDDDRSLSKLRPLNKYGYSKQLFDQWLLQRGWLSQRLLSGASFVGLKYSNVFGPNEYHKAHMRSMVLRSFEQITATGVVKLFKSYRPEYADGEQVRDFLYVKDAAAMTVFFADAGYAACGLHNIGFGSVRSWNDLARATFAALKRPVRIEYIEMPEELRNRYQYYTCLDISKLRKAGYTAPLTTLEAAIEDTCAYLVDRRHLGE